MDRNFYCVYDFETGSRNPFNTQPTQLAAVMVNARSLTIVPDSLFESKIKPEWDVDKCKKMGVHPVEDEALIKTNLTREELDEAPPLKQVWQDFQDYLKKYNKKSETGDNWEAPIPVGHNNNSFDDIIIRRLCLDYGPKLDEYGAWSIFHPNISYDIHRLFRAMSAGSNIFPKNSYSMDSMREFMGISAENAHRADVDVKTTAIMLIKYLKLMKTLLSGGFEYRIQFENCFTEEENRIIHS